MIAAAAYYAYREHQRKVQEEQEEQKRDLTTDQTRPDNSEGNLPNNIGSASSPANWFASLPLEETALRCYYGSDRDFETHENDAESSSINNPGEMSEVITANAESMIHRENIVTNSANHQNSTVSPIPLETTTFQDSVRKEWIQAVFGTDFPKKGKHDKTISFHNVSRQDNHCIQSAWSGVGLARIAPFTTYTVELPAFLDTQHSESSSTTDEKKEMKSPQHDFASSTPTLPTQQKLGVTLSRLALGLYVRYVYPGSEAWCAGVKPGSILVSINHGTINLLAEPSKAALERIWQYEGYGISVAETIDSSVHSTGLPVGFDHSDRTLSPTIKAYEMVVRHPISMTFILHGLLYDVLFLSNPPYGIEWAPCGNFCLVKKVTSERVKRAGIQPSSIVASVTSNDLNNSLSIYDLDHTSGAEALKNAVLLKGPIQVQLCFTPPKARSGEWERQQDDVQQQKENVNNTKRDSRAAHNGRHHSYYRNGISQRQRAHVVGEVDGVQVRIHPLVPRGILRRNSSQSTVQSAGLVNLSIMAARVSAGEYFPLGLSSRNSMMALMHRASERSPRGHKHPSLARLDYRTCPPMEKALLECWSSSQALLYLCRYHLAEYDESSLQNFSGDNFNDPDLFEFLLEEKASTITVAFWLFWMAWLTANENQPLNLAQRLLELAQGDIFQLAHPMEFLAEAFGNEDLKRSLSKLRVHRIEAIQQRNLHHHQQTNLSDVRRDGNSQHVTGTSKDMTARKGESSLQEQNLSSHSGDSLNPKIHCLTKESTHIHEKKEPKRLFRIFRKMKLSSRKKKGNRRKGKAEPISLVLVEEEALPLEKKPNVLADSSRSVLIHPQEDVCDMATCPNDSASPLPDLGFSHTMLLLEELEAVCTDIEKSLMQTFSQKFARWALQPWTPSKETALAQVTHAMRERLKKCNQSDSLMPLANPFDSSESLMSIDADSCYILPSAHFPLLLTFDCPRDTNVSSKTASIIHASCATRTEEMYRTVIELVSLKGSRLTSDHEKTASRGFLVHAAVAGTIVESGRSIGVERDSICHVWDVGNVLVFDSRSSWGPPKTLTLRLSEAILDEDGKEKISSSDPSSGQLRYQIECGYCWIDLSSLWNQNHVFSNVNSSKRTTIKTRVIPPDAFREFDEHGDLVDGTFSSSNSGESETIELELRITVKLLDVVGSPRRSVLYKHDDDVRQDMFAMEFIKSCDRILRSCGLDMKILTFRCVPVGKSRGFIQWVHGSVSLSEICQPFAGSILGRRWDSRLETSKHDNNDDSDDNTLSSTARAGVTQYESLSWVRHKDIGGQKVESVAAFNPIQDFLRSVAYDSEGPYKIRREVMDKYVKSCAGYCIITYLLGVGDRHLDNLLLHQSGHFFHCDFSFILGNDPKKYLPMRITKDMVNGMGGPQSDNFCQFLSLACATFLTLRRPANVRHLLSLVRVMEGSGVPDLEKTQSLESAIQGLRDRMRLDLNDEEAIIFIEKLIEDSCASKMWMAVDAIHSLAQRF